MSVEYEHTGAAGKYKIQLDDTIPIDRVYGIERNRYSPARGELTVPVIMLWKQPDKQPAAENLTGSLQHGDEVNVIRSIKRNLETYCYVKARVVFNGKVYHQWGWVLERMLETAGAKHYETAVT